jgi:hypothetical protein
VDGKDHWWCTHHNRYVQHRPSECKAGQKKAPEENKPPERDGLALDSALQAQVASGSDAYGDEE